MAVELPEFLPLEEAARQYKVGPETLKRAIESGKIRAVQASGRVFVANEDAAMVAVQVQASNDGDEFVSIREASRRLNLHPTTVWRWREYGWLPEKGRGSNRVVLISMRQAERLAALRKAQGKKGRRLIPKRLSEKS